MVKKKKDRGVFGNLLWQQRKQQKLTMLKLAQSIDVSESYISLLESGARQQPARELVLKLAHALGARSNNQLADQFLLAAGYFPADKQMYENHGDTIQSYQDEIRHDPHNYPAYNSLIFAYIKLREKDKALALIETALNIFESTYQITSLSASLALSQKDFKEAIKLQKKALKSFNKEKEQSEQSQFKPKENERLRLNLAVMYFLKGLHHQNEWFSEHKRTEQNKAKKEYAESKLILEALLQESPNIYALDEYARVTFNQAFIGGENEKTQQQYWKTSSQTFQKVLADPNKFALGRQILSEACVFLAHAYSHQKKFEQAEILIHTLEISTNPSTSLIYYLKACFHSLRGEDEQNNAEVTPALEALRTAHRLDANFAQQALSDPDLNWLREQSQTELQAILKRSDS